MPKAFITGVTGQCASYLVELLLDDGFEVHGLVRRASSMRRERIDHLVHNPKIYNRSFFLHYGDLTDGTNISSLIKSISPDYCWNLGAQSHVKISFEVPEYSGNTDGLGVIRLLEAIRNNCPDCRFYQASTSEMFGKVAETPQNELTPFRPQSPYAAAKLYAYWVTRNYRDAYDLFASNGILFNNESPRRGENFVTRKITIAAARIKYGLQECLELGNLKAKRDWGYAYDYMNAAYMMLLHDEPDDFVIATGENHTVEEFCNRAFEVANIPLTFTGKDLNRVGVDKDGVVRVRVNPEYFRPLEVETLLGDPSKAKRVLDWKPSVKFDQLVQMMTEHDIEKLKEEIE